MRRLVLLFAIVGCSGPSSSRRAPPMDGPSVTPVPQPGGDPGEPAMTGSVTRTGTATPDGTPTATPPATVKPATVTPTPAGLSAEAAELVNAHNRRRADHCAGPVQWSAALAKVAQAWADHLKADRCGFDHSPNNSYGENLAAGSIGMLSPTAVVDMWYDEVSQYDYGNPGFSGTTGHFTQVVWKNTTRVGCGTVTCNDMQIWVCEYDPPGNYEGEYPANVAKKCR